MYDFTIIGGGIVGLAVGHALFGRYPKASVLIIEKEQEVAAHQTGHNSGVIHSGIYYKPGSFKAKFAKAGNQSMTAFCQKHGLKVDICGKVIVATNKKELPLLDHLYQRGIDNGLDLRMLSKEELHEAEPYVNGLAAISVPTAGIVSYKEVAEKLASLIAEKGGEIQLGTTVETISESNEGATIETDKGTFQTSYLINCAGLHSDRIAKLAGYHVDMKIVPFRGEYYKLRPEKRHLVKNLIYPVPNPDFPFLGVHFTRMIDGEVDAGPNAVLSFKREGYRKTDIDWQDVAEVIRYKGFWQLATKYWKEGTEEMIRSFSKKKFVENLQHLIPDVTEADLVPGPSGVRAQALTTDGKLVDDFQLIRGRKSLHVCNAPSPAATASLEIGKAIVEKVFQYK
ncbi:MULTISPECIES: L-2-hydroxyglutarate oxidase [Shouchella]|uniref:L-2-hydroxyglutarate oxidase n=1 Tax=Shouchella TaxID=2893057 RepID=UPI00091FE673|nr:MULTISPECIES: L-2-hydroxyglutarate oxidase [Shouchella]MCM3381003.1 L-2-hydroxyglutarate oxidase [Shouchella rhizosphaerae]MDO7285042.1 L-2-hydroxyglutarate oxidase [Shouchella clausii]MDO7305090.1 L-2-hydroxyglutarate oxidase [Shouchella clausii]PAE81393.1 hydroxyglutarate oxidase [Shouchella clausii]SHL25428.1 L-2-hydroxyglutarate oxidase [Shouchella rhizosphaerae]